MRHSTRFFLLSLSLASLLGLAACGGPKTFTKGTYDDPERPQLLDDKFNEADMQQMAETIVKAMVACDPIADAPKSKKPVVMVAPIQNRTQEHIDMDSITEKVRTALLKSKKVRFINNQARVALDEEYNYQEGGNVSKETQKKRGKQTGADYVMNGAMATNIQEVKNDKRIYYKITMNLTNTETSEIECTEEREITKVYRKQ